MRGGFSTVLACTALIVLPPWRWTRLVPDVLVLDGLDVLEVFYLLMDLFSVDADFIHW